MSHWQLLVGDLVDWSWLGRGARRGGVIRPPCALELRRAALSCAHLSRWGGVGWGVVGFVLGFVHASHSSLEVDAANVIGVPIRNREV